MSIPVPLDRLRAAVAERGTTAYVLTVGDDGAPHAVHAPVRLENDVLVVEVGRRSAANATARRTVSLVYPVGGPNDYSLIVDGTAVVVAGDATARLLVTPTRAVLHRSAPAPDPSTSACGADCVPLLRTSYDGPLLSADSHVVPLPTFWRDYLPPRLRDRAPVVEATDDGDVVVFEGRRTPVMAINSIAGKPREGQGFAYRRLAEQVTGGHDPAARVADQDRDGVVAEVLYGGGPLQTEDAELFLASHYAYNDWLADFCRHAPDRLLGVAYVPFASPEIAVAEIRRARRLGLRSTLVPAAPPSGHWWDEAWTPVWKALVDEGLPAGLHVGFGFARKHRFEGGPAFMTDVMMTKMEMAGPLADLVFGGVLARHPALRVISVEAYIGWLPFVAEYVDHAYRVHRYWNDLGLAEPPSAYLRRQVFATFIDDAVGLRERHAFGVENLLWSSDYPHGESTFPRSRDHVAAAFAGIPADETRMIVYENARRLYRL